MSELAGCRTRVCTPKKTEIETCYLSFLNISIKSEAILLGINPIQPISAGSELAKH